MLVEFMDSAASSFAGTGVRLLSEPGHNMQGAGMVCKETGAPKGVFGVYDELLG